MYPTRIIINSHPDKRKDRRNKKLILIHTLKEHRKKNNRKPSGKKLIIYADSLYFSATKKDGSGKTVHLSYNIILSMLPA